MTCFASTGVLGERRQQRGVMRFLIHASIWDVLLIALLVGLALWWGVSRLFRRRP